MTRRKQHCPKRMKWEGGEGEEPPAGYREDDGGCPEDDEDEEEEEEEGVSGGSSGSPPRSPIPSSTDGVEQDLAVNERLPPRETNNSPSSKTNRGGSPRSESSLPPYEVPLLATVSPRRSPPAPDVLDFSTKRPASPARSPAAAMNLSNSNDDTPIDLTIRSKKIKLDPSPVSPPSSSSSSNDAYARMNRPWAQYAAPAIRPVSRGEMMTPPGDPVHLWNGKHGKMPYGGSSFPAAGSDATKALEKMCELSKLQDEPRSVLAPSPGRHSAWQSHWLNKGADQTKDVLKCVWCKMSFPTLQAMSAHMAETKHGAATAQSLHPPPPSPLPPPPPPPVSAASSSAHKNDLNMLIKETMPLPRKLVRGQDVWLGKGAEQTRQILKCMWCGQSFRSLQEMTTHMQQTQHYTNIISQEQIISWKSADENKSSGGGGGGGAGSASTSSPAGAVNTSANHVSAVLTCKVCDQAFNSLKELSVHMVKNSHYKEHMMRSITEGSNRRRQTREKRKKSLPVRKLLELERAQHEVKNGDGGYPTGGGFKAVNDTNNHRLGRIICEKCGEKVDVASFMEHLRVCVTMTADQKNLLKTALMSQNSVSASESGREKRAKKEDRSHAAADLSMNRPAAAAATAVTGSSSSPSVLNAIEKLIEKSFDSRLRYGTSAAGASIGESILKRLGIDESVDATKPIMDVQAMHLLRSYQSLGRHERSGSESSSMSPELAAMRSDSTTPDRKYESDYQRVRSATPKSTPERHHSPPKRSGNKNHHGQETAAAAAAAAVAGAGPEVKSEAEDGELMEVKKEYVDEDDGGCSSVAKSPAEQQRIRSRESAEDETNGSSRGPTPTANVKSPSSPAGSDKSTTDNGKKTAVTSSLGALSSMFESLTSAAGNGGGGGGSSTTVNGESGCGGKGGGGGGAASSHPLAALQKLCDKTENHHHPHHRPSSRSSSNASATNGTAAGPAQCMSPPASVTGGTAPGAILAFSWACNDAVMTADSIMKCAFCDTPFISKGAYRHHLSKVHFVKEGITPEPIMLKPASAASSSSTTTTTAAHSPSPSPSSSSQNKSSPSHNNNNINSNNNNNNNGNGNNNNNGSPSTSAGGGGAKSPEPKNGGYDESPHSKFLKYTELAKQLSSKYV